ncbi:hypothetical protein GCM10020219_000380 [Nonomuraea dietziae]
MSERAVPFHCPYCGDEDLEPYEGRRGLVLQVLRARLQAEVSRNRSEDMTLVDLEVTLREQRGTLDLQAIVESAAVFLEDAPAREIIRWAAATFGDRLCLTSSMSDALLIDLVSRVKPRGWTCCSSTRATTSPRRSAPVTRLQQVYDVNVINVQPLADGR